VSVAASGIVTLTTDFGTRDAYAGAMKGASLSVQADVRIVDITHDITPHDTMEAAFVLASAFRTFPAGTVHVAVVDPGVGSERRAIAAHGGGWYFVGPDNGVLTWALDSLGAWRAVELVDPRYFRKPVSPTFHGRDIFGPVAAHLASGVPLEAFGPEIGDLTPLPAGVLGISREAITCEVVHVDRFGNLITNLDRTTLDTLRNGRAMAIDIAGVTIDGLADTYAVTDTGALMALIESTGRLEIAVNEGSAARALGAGRGTPVNVRLG
jgi:S-adenosylmethionine hydrolase